MRRYLTIREGLQIIIGTESCGFLPGPPENDIESVESEVARWVGNNGDHPDVVEANRWLERVAAPIERKRKERQFLGRLAEHQMNLETWYREEGDMWASWRAKHGPEAKQFEKELRREMGLD